MRFRRQHLVPLQPRDIVDFLDGEALRRAREFGDEQDLRPILRTATGDLRQIDDRDDLAANVRDAENLRFRARDGRDGGHRENFTDLEYIDAVEFALLRIRGFAQAEQQQLEHIVAGEPDPLLDIVL